MRTIYIPLLILLIFGSSIAEAQPRKVVYDTDLAMDDWFGLLYLLKSQEFIVEGITVPGNGEANCQFARPVAQKLLALPQREMAVNVPITCGSTAPLDGYFTFPRDWRKGANTLHGLIDYSDESYLSKLGEPYDEMEASDFLIKQLEANEELEIISVGPLSNIAMVILRRPDLVKNISKLWIMGGNLLVEGNIGNNPYPSIQHLKNNAAEWNIWTDIEAAKIVFDSDLPIYLVPLDATNTVPITASFIEKYKKQIKATRTPDPVAEFIAWNYDLPFVKDWLSQDRFYFWDTLAVGVAIDESMCKKWMQTGAKILNQPTENFLVYTDQKKPAFPKNNVYGKARTNFHPLIAGALVEDENSSRINICLAADHKRFYDHFLQTTTRSKKEIKE